MSNIAAIEIPKVRHVTVLDQKGKHHPFTVVDCFSFAYHDYLIARPVNDDSQDGKGIFLQVVPAGDEVEYRYIADDAEWHRVLAYAVEASIVWEGEVTRGYPGLGMKFSLWKWLERVCEKNGYAVFLVIYFLFRVLSRFSHYALLIMSPLLLFAVYAWIMWMKRRIAQRRGRRGR